MIDLIVQRIHRRRRRPVLAGKNFSSDVAGDGPSGKRRAVSDSQEAAEVRQGLPSGDIAARLMRLVRSGFLRRVLAQWRDTSLRSRRLREISAWLENFGVDFPVEQPEQAAAALSALNQHGNWRWKTLEQVFQLGSNTLSRIARQVPGAGARSTNLLLRALNLSWQERILAESSESETGQDPCPICLRPLADDDDTTDLDCQHTFHSDCVGNWFMNGQNTCPLCRGLGNRNE